MDRIRFEERKQEDAHFQVIRNLEIAVLLHSGGDAMPGSGMAFEYPFVQPTP